MANDKIEFRRSVEKDLNCLSKQDPLRVMRRINGLAGDPRPNDYKKLSGRERYRLRQGDDRILCEILDDKLIVCIVRIRHRHDIYD